MDHINWNMDLHRITAAEKQRRSQQRELHNRINRKHRIENERD